MIWIIFVCLSETHWSPSECHNRCFYSPHFRCSSKHPLMMLFCANFHWKRIAQNSLRQSYFACISISRQAVMAFKPPQWVGNDPDSNGFSPSSRFLWRLTDPSQVPREWVGESRSRSLSKWISTILWRLKEYFHTFCQFHHFYTVWLLVGSSFFFPPARWCDDDRDHCVKEEVVSGMCGRCRHACLEPFRGYHSS